MAFPLFLNTGLCHLKQTHSLFYPPRLPRYGLAEGDQGLLKGNWETERGKLLDFLNITHWCCFYGYFFLSVLPLFFLNTL